MFPVIPRPQNIVLKSGRENVDTVVNYICDESVAKEGYRLSVGESGVTVTYRTDAGKFYACQTLKMLKDTLGYYPHCEVSDAPKTSFRAVMLDVGRYYLPMDAIKMLIDDAVALKLNVLYWHLSEDQGWRPDIKSRPRLREVGSKRKKTNWFPIPCEGHYSREEMEEIVAYCHERHMIVVPEIDVPGHVRAALASYPEIACFPRAFKVANHWGVKHDILCAGKEETYRFLFDVFTELSEIFTDGYFGLGGDEAVKTRWKLCPNCQRVIKEQGLKDEDDLQTFFMNRLNREFFAPRGVKPVIWVHGKAPDGIDKEFVLMYYGGDNCLESMRANAAIGYQVLNSDSAYFYFDLLHSEVPLKKAYEGGKAEELAENQLGGALSLWSEYIPRLKTLEKRAFPRLLAGAEALWTKYDATEYNSFVEKAELYTETYGKGRNFTSVKNGNPEGLRKTIEHLWWLRRPLHWEGLGNLIDNAKVAKIAKKSSKK